MGTQTRRPMLLIGCRQRCSGSDGGDEPVLSTRIQLDSPPTWLTPSKQDVNMPPLDMASYSCDCFRSAIVCLVLLGEQVDPSLIGPGLTGRSGDGSRMME